MDIMDSIKEFIWDIIGYLIPGLYLFILLYICLDNSYLSCIPVPPNLQVWVIMIVSYIFGYAIYGLGALKEHILGDKSYVKIIESKVKSRIAFEITRKDIISKFTKTDSNFENATVRDFRSIAMGLFPESEKKIYTFTFRADISNHAGNISFLIGAIGIVSIILKCIFSFYLFKTDVLFIIIYVCLIISYFLFEQTRNKFYAISIGLPFSIYSSNLLKNGN
jgi:hypothetical protein